MAEDQFLVLAPKSMVSSLFAQGGSGSGVGGSAVLNNDITLLLGGGKGTLSFCCFKATSRVPRDSTGM